MIAITSRITIGIIVKMQFRTETMFIGLWNFEGLQNPAQKWESPKNLV